jgi:hypothetical protein
MKLRFLFLASLSLLSLTGCDSVKSELGLTRRDPDEFAIVPRAPLQVPLNLDQVTQLNPPQPGAPRPQEIPPTIAAQEALKGGPIPKATAPSAAEQSLLAKTGATQTDPNIRTIVNSETDEEAERNRPTVQRIFGTNNDTPAATVVDAPSELKRIQENKAQGEPVTKGETPTRDE